ncbi:MarR family winged helix-turn-helix transcriptional regulator [Alteribacillus sp. HJP-4]|uniref:MarR family winged helix-turn-helix transcriptional regulator n=1 Tax=Alteribacillus sp. HJP-4 TaxID=2775394 RepID=UPI0035CD1162
MSLEDYKRVFLESVYSMETIAKYLQPKMPLLSELQLTSRQEAMMILFIRNENITLSGMAEQLGISKSAVSQALNKLENEDLLIRSINEQNRREINMALGRTGVRLKEQFEAFEESIIRDYISQLDIEDLKQVRDVINTLKEIIKKEEDVNE